MKIVSKPRLRRLSEYVNVPGGDGMRKVTAEDKVRAVPLSVVLSARFAFFTPACVSRFPGLPSGNPGAFAEVCRKKRILTIYCCIVSYLEKQKQATNRIIGDFMADVGCRYEKVSRRFSSRDHFVAVCVFVVSIVLLALGKILG